MKRQKLKEALLAIDWGANLAHFLKDVSSVTSVAESNLRLALWPPVSEFMSQNLDRITLHGMVKQGWDNGGSP